MRRTIPIALVFATLALLAVACGGPSVGSSESGNEGSPQEELPQEEAPKVEEEAPAEENAGPVEVETTVLASGLEAPWGLAFLPDGSALVSERDNDRILSLDASGNTNEVQTLPADASGEGGLLGIALSPDYESDELVYAYYTTAEDNRLARFRLGEEPDIILSGIPVESFHNGGRIAFGPDGMLYVGTGDGGQTSTSQDLNSLGGKILRLTPDGGVPSDNPFSGSPVYSYGHRNVQGLAWDESGQLYASEFGQNTYDEVNQIQAGGNYGWPNVEGSGGEPDYIDPISTFSTDEASPSGAEILTSGLIPQWQGNFFMASLRGQNLWRLALDPSGSVAERENLLQNQAGRLRHVAQAPDGSLWVLTSNRDGRGSPTADDDRILRLAPAGE